MIHGFIPPKRFFPYLTWTEIQEMEHPENVVIIQPIGAIEQHGPHLPLVVDAALGTGILGQALEKLDQEISAYALPPVYYGKSNEHWNFPGTITLQVETLLAILHDLAESLYQAGFRKLVLFNSHGGQPQVMDIAARDIHQKYGDFIVFPLFVWRVPHIAQELFTPEELEYGIHAGDIETSAMLSLLPEQVRMDKAVKEFPQGLPQESLLSMEGKLPFAWMTQELSKSGVLGDATLATREKGDRLLASVVTSWVEVFKDIAKFQQPSGRSHEQ